MKEQILNNVILKYLNHLNNSIWIIDEAYKFEFANFIQSNIDFENQSDEEILTLLLRSQKIKYDKSTGIQFILKSAKKKRQANLLVWLTFNFLDNLKQKNLKK
ncbi:MAG: hypothetical protein KBG17_01725 [Paludibacteraceae bacterium]|nr:hypothetical protein [Paludibacteraceae bacterium]